MSGTAVFAAVLGLASRYPTAAGLMLTFPMLNGFAFIYSRHEDVAAATAPMLWMPLLNAAICVAYMSAFIALAGWAPVAVLAWSIAAGAAVLWLVMARSQRVRRGVARAWQWHYVAAVPIAGAVLTLAWWIGFSAGAAPVAAPSALQWYKVVLFAIALGMLIVLPSLLGWGPGARGILSGLPLVSLAGLLGIALDGTIALEARRALFGQMMLGVWLSPAIAVAYIFGVSRAIARARASCGRSMRWVPRAWRRRGIRAGRAAACRSRATTGRRSRSQRSSCATWASSRCWSAGWRWAAT
jgi:hypothetical protein